MPEHEDIKVTDRRSAFKALGVVAAGVTGVSLLDADPASAAVVNLALDTTNSSSAVTQLGTTGTPKAVLFVDDASGQSISSSTFPSAITGWSNTRNGVYGFTESGNGVVGYTFNGTAGVYGQADNPNGYGVHGVGTGQGAAVYGTCSAGYGVLGSADHGTGAQGFTVDGFGLGGVASGSGVGVSGASTTGIDVYAQGTGRLAQFTSSTTGTPTHTGVTGEQVRDTAGDLYLAFSGNTWRRAATVRPTYAGGAQHLLASPIRLLDTRAGKASRNGATGIFAGNSTFALAVRGFTYQSQTIPDDAIGIIGNLTIASAEGNGYATLFPGGGTKPTASSINFATGQSIANGFTAAIGANGKINIYVSAKTHVVFDVVGFLA